VPITFHDRVVGESKISLSIAIEALWLVPVLRFPWLARTWPARTAPLARPAGVAEPSPFGDVGEGPSGELGDGPGAAKLGGTASR
jgi:hypothetical protein